jgi:hypothetical protein
MHVRCSTSLALLAVLSIGGLIIGFFFTYVAADEGAWPMCALVARRRFGLACNSWSSLCFHVFILCLGLHAALWRLLKHPATLCFYAVFASKIAPTTLCVRFATVVCVYAGASANDMFDKTFASRLESFSQYITVQLRVIMAVADGIGSHGSLAQPCLICAPFAVPVCVSCRSGGSTKAYTNHFSEEWRLQPG